ncbi:unnamed protein product, partial [Fusarium langsethiae]
DLTEHFSQEEFAQFINFLLVCLVKVTKDLILNDRTTVAKFGQVNQLQSWKQGTVRTGFTAERVLQLSCRRKATVPVDHVYSLMGILGVRFQSFHAEGYPKALSRLLDEVIITHNDVSVFNWSGVEMGSPVRGRSMYPAFHKAYGNEEDRSRKYNMMISAEVQKKRKQVMITYQGVITMLRDAIDCIKVQGKKGLPLEWVREITEFVKESSFDKLEPEMENIGKILLYIKDHCVQPTPASPVVEKQPEVENESSVESLLLVEEKTSRSFRPSMPSMKLSSGLKAARLPSFKAPSISKPSFSRTHSEPVVAQDAGFVQPPKPIVPEVLEWMTLDQEVKDYLKSLSSKQSASKPFLPTRIMDLKFKLDDPETTTKQGNDNSNSSPSDLICPNPIIINSSGIEGIFDIQRVIVTMIDREKLSRQVARAPNPKQKITGWCTISTGFARVVVNFSCEQHILKKQLDAEQAVEDRIVREDRASKMGSEIGDHEAGSKENVSATEQSEEKEEQVSSSKPTKEEQTIVRIINFIQEPQLRFIAGEWVLARFSGTPGAKWFLCYLELGSTHSLYGHRIATTEIDFANSAVEAGLVNAWQTYMGRKKRKMCNILSTYIKSFESAGKSQEMLSKSSAIAEQNYARLVDAGNQSLERVISFRSSTSTLKQPLLDSTKDGGAKYEKDVDSDDDDKGGLFDNLLDQGKEAAMALGEFTVLAAFEKICEMHAKHLDKYLATSVLKKTPTRLQTAVESVDENKGFLPAMFHSSQRVHMF